MIILIFLVCINSALFFGDAFVAKSSASVHVSSTTALWRSRCVLARLLPTPTATRSRTFLATARDNEETSSIALSPWRDDGQGENAARVALRELRRQIDSGATPGDVMNTLVDGVIVAGAQELLVTEASIILQRYRPLAEAAERGDLVAMLQSSKSISAARGAATSDREDGRNYLLDTVKAEVIDELHTAWDESVMKWRKKALAVEKYRSTNPTVNAAVYTYMVNCCTRQGMWEVAYDALTYAGLMSAGPFFLSRKELGFGAPSLVLDMDKMACYVAEKILDIDLDVWRRKGGDLGAGQGTVGNKKPGVGVEEMNFLQNEESASHLAALRVQDMTLAAGRVALRKIRSQLRDAPGTGPAEPASLVILCSTTTSAMYLRELLVPPRAIETLLALDFSGAVDIDANHGRRLANDSDEAKALELLTGASVPFVICGDSLRAWIAQEDDVKVEV